MNSCADQIDKKLVELIFDAAEHPVRWKSVISYIMGATNAPAAMITLRDKKTCQIIDDNALVNEFQSPLIDGFPIPVAQYYLRELRRNDPWAEAQRAHFPTRPQAMSEICAPEDYPDHVFFRWLGELGICDTVAVAIDQSDTHWTALNVFVPTHDESVRMRALSLLNTHLSVLKNGWKNSQQLIRSSQANEAILEQLTDFGIPACVLDARATVLRNNEAFEHLATTGLVVIAPANRGLSVAYQSEFQGLDGSLTKKIARHEASDENVSLLGRPFDLDPLYQGSDWQDWLVTIRISEARNETKRGRPLDLTCLEPREAQFFELKNSGSSTIGAGSAVGLRRTQSFTIWATIRRKLGI